jgi:hypothetical protein
MKQLITKGGTQLFEEWLLGPWKRESAGEDRKYNELVGNKASVITNDRQKTRIYINVNWSKVK